MREFSVILATDQKYGIGKNGQLPWNLPKELKSFIDKTVTTIDNKKQNAVIMGRNTAERLSFFNLIIILRV